MLQLTTIHSFIFKRVPGRKVYTHVTFALQMQTYELVSV